jgi:hypothetical protein
VLLFSANDGSGPVYKFPAYDYFAPVLEPLLEEVRTQSQGGSLPEADPGVVTHTTRCGQARDGSAVHGFQFHLHKSGLRPC